MWVVKLGGSLADSAELPRWLDALAGVGAVIVPGGGPFADAVRAAQARWHFDEATAHHMAILGMRQYGRMLAGLCPRLRAADTEDGLASTPGAATVWLPSPERLDKAAIPASWDVSSDSLAAWLAGQVRAANLLLVKSVAAAALDMPASQLVNQGWVDKVFPTYAAKSGCPGWLCGPGGHAGLAEALADPARHFARILL
jgi:aspartokinase-like uncharacterized kinase